MCKICGFDTENLIINRILYHKCPNCGFLCKDDSFILSMEDEFDRYKHHNNNDENYFIYQKNFYEMIKPYLKGKILDYGCGDNHILSNIINDEGYISSYYDLYFYDDKSVLNKVYDSIILEEVIEHLKDPVNILKNLIKSMRKEGHLIIRTNLLKESINLNSWWYLRDSTHISFFTYESFLKCCELFGLDIIYCNDKDLIIMKRV